MQVFCRFLDRVPEGRTFSGVIFFLAVLVLLIGGLRGEENDFMRGDANQDGFVSISDALTLNNFMFIGQDPPQVFGLRGCG